jgi:acyl carrier protein
MKTSDVVVRDALARYLHLDAIAIESWHHLELDLHLSPGDLALVALEVEDAEDVAIPADALMAASTVGDLVALVRRIVARERLANALDRVA